MREKQPEPEWYRELKSAPVSQPGFTRAHVREVKRRAREPDRGRRRASGPLLTAALSAGLLLLAVGIWSSGLWQPREGSMESAAWQPRSVHSAGGQILLEVLPGGDYRAEQPAGALWLFHLPREQLLGRSLRIEAVHQESGLQLVELRETLVQEQLIVRESAGLTGVKSLFHLPAGGAWRFDVYLDGSRWGDVVFQVPEPQSVWEPTPLFVPGSMPEKSAVETAQALRGEKGRLGLLDSRFSAGQENKCMWYFWGKPEELQAPVRIIALRQGTQEWIQALPTDGSPLGDGLGVADASLHTGLSLPAAGIWRVAVVMNGQYFGSVKVEVY